MKKKVIIAAFFSLFAASVFGIVASAQVNELERLRLENRYLREKNDSLKRELYRFQSETVFVLWDGMTGLADNNDESLDYDSFGLNGTRIDNEYSRRCLAALPSFTLPYRDVFEKYIDLYTVSRKKIMPNILARYFKYFPLFKGVFDKYGVPEEMVALCIVESAVSRKALSRAGAYGIWQLMPETARSYGLVVNETIDQRLDITLSTDAAARLLRDLKKKLGSWELAVLGYNCGAGNVRKAIIRSNGSTSVWDIYEYLPIETRAYLPSLVGAAVCVRFYDEYNIKVRPMAADAFDVYFVKWDRSIGDLAEVVGCAAEYLSEINCQYLNSVVPAGYPIRVPRGGAAKLKNAEQ